MYKRTQLHLDDDLWKTLHIRATQSAESVSELVRGALRERYLGAGGTPCRRSSESGKAEFFRYRSVRARSAQGRQAEGA